jgi:multidrug resistance efflux pump
VTISRLVQGNIDSTLTAAGSTDVLRKEKVLSPVAGRVISVNVQEGSHVRLGDVMVVLRTRESQAAIEGADLLMRAATTERQREEAQRARALTDSLSPQIFLRASFDGLVASRNVSPGELVGEQAELLTVIDPSTVMFVAGIPITALSAIHPNLPARIRLPQFPALRLDAVVDAVSPQAESQRYDIT